MWQIARPGQGFPRFIDVFLLFVTANPPGLFTISLSARGRNISGRRHRSAWKYTSYIYNYKYCTLKVHCISQKKKPFLLIIANLETRII